NYWDRIWKIENKETWRIYPETNKRIIEVIGSNKEVLEVGCGVGILLKQIKANSNKVTGIDISAFAISLLKEDGINGIQSVLPNIPLNDNSFDVVVGTEILEHMDNDKELLIQCDRVCKNGGKIIFVVPDNCLGPEDEPEHIRKYTPEEFQKLLSSVSRKVLVERFTDKFIAPFRGKAMNISIPLLIGIVTKE
ncbi:MAG: class I SAM-dependent methyltransferase, partial [Nanoarchaeota archaeon]